jgi:hypothetical protein
MLEIVTLLGTVVAVTVRVPALLSASLTVAIVEFAAGDPCLRPVPTFEGVIVGAVLVLRTWSEKLASVVALQLSVARTVIVCVPTGPALLIETTPVEELTEIVPV